MTPTPEQVAQWADQAGVDDWCVDGHCQECGTNLTHLQKITALAYNAGRVAQAEQDAKLCETTPIQTYMVSGYVSQVKEARLAIKDAIRANAPKVDV